MNSKKSVFTSLLLDLPWHRLLVGVVRWAALLSQAACAGASFFEASDHIHYLAYAEAAAESDASDADWSHRDLAEGDTCLSSCARTAEGIPSVQVGLEWYTSVAARDDDLESLDASSLGRHDPGLDTRCVAAVRHVVGRHAQGLENTFASVGYIAEVPNKVRLIAVESS